MDFRRFIDVSSFTINKVVDLIECEIGNRDEYYFSWTVHGTTSSLQSSPPVSFNSISSSRELCQFKNSEQNSKRYL